jgi:hypothetical protein
MLAPYQGSYLPFVHSYEGRLLAGDPRPAVLERYPSRPVYLYHVTEAVRRLRSQRLLLKEDAAAQLKLANEQQLWER